MEAAIRVEAGLSSPPVPSTVSEGALLPSV